MIHKFFKYLFIYLFSQATVFEVLNNFSEEINEQIFRSATHADFYSVFNIM